MEDLDMTQALRRYVEAGEPPFSLTANALISQARRRHRWRVGLGIGGGGAATTLAILSAMALVPSGGGPTAGFGGCDVELPLGIRSTATATPPDIPKPSPSAPTPLGQPTPTSAPPSGSPASATAPSASAPGPVPSGTAPLPGGARTLPIAPEAAPADNPGGNLGATVAVVVVDTSRLDEMSCFLKRRLLELRPRATFAPHQGAPMDVIWDKGTGPDGRTVLVYRAGAYVIEGPLLCLITVAVFQGDQGPAPGISHSEYQATATHKTKSSTIVVTVEGGAISDAAAMAIAKAPELDLYR